MKDLLLMLAHLLATLAKLLGPGGAKAIVADSLLMKQQLLITRCGLSINSPDTGINSPRTGSTQSSSNL
jgi:hypothetical protein